MHRDSRDAKKALKIIAICAFFLLIIGYGFLRSRELLFGIKIRDVKINESVALPQMNLKTDVVKFSGNAKNAVTLTLNGREISIDQEGNFNESVALLSGYNVIKIEATDKFGSVDEKNYQVIYAP
jgi:hypothetical protein